MGSGTVEVTIAENRDRLCLTGSSEGSDLHVVLGRQPQARQPLEVAVNTNF